MKMKNSAPKFTGCTQCSFESEIYNIKSLQIMDKTSQISELLL